MSASTPRPVQQVGWLAHAPTQAVQHLAAGERGGELLDGSRLLPRDLSNKSAGWRTPPRKPSNNSPPESVVASCWTDVGFYPETCPTSRLVGARHHTSRPTTRRRRVWWRVVGRMSASTPRPVQQVGEVGEAVAVVVASCRTATDAITGSATHHGQSRPQPPTTAATTSHAVTASHHRHRHHRKHQHQHRRWSEHLRRLSTAPATSLTKTGFRRLVPRCRTPAR